MWKFSAALSSVCYYLFLGALHKQKSLLALLFIVYSDAAKLNAKAWHGPIHISTAF